MKSMTIEEQKNEGLQVLKEIKRVCSILNIKYYLAYGTLIGAIRHKGYIPWDDDIDLWMMRSDYEIFISKFNSICKPDYKLKSWHTDSNYPFLVAKVISKRTYVEEKCFKPQEGLGVWVDIFPIDFVSDKNTSRMQDAVILEHKRWMALWNYSTIGAKIKLFFYNLMQKDTKFKDRKLIPSDLTKEIYDISYSIETSNKVVSPCSDHGIKRHMDYEDFKETIEVPFEDEEFSIPAGYDHLLRTIYGDYMKLPPVPQRKFDQHLRKAIWLNK